MGETMPGIDGKALKSLFRKIADSGVSVDYALGLGDKPETSAFLVHKSKKMTALEAEMKKAGKFRKIGIGSLEVRDGAVVLTERRALSQSARLLRQLFKANGLAAFEARVAEPAVAGGAPPDGARDTAALAERRAGRLAEMARLRDRLAALARRIGG